MHRRVDYPRCQLDLRIGTEPRIQLTLREQPAVWDFFKSETARWEFNVLAFFCRIRATG